MGTDASQRGDRQRRRVGAWRIETELGRGGMASVYAVTHKEFGKRAALKLSHRTIASEPNAAQAFLREARIVHAIGHPGVPDVFATGRCDGRPYLVMERLAGKTLADLQPERAEALAIIRELCEVLGAAHAAGVVHRDLKLANVFVCDAPYGGNRRVKLIDWGVAHIRGDEDPLSGMIAGTLTYVAPEQIRGDELTAATDVYSLGVMAFELLCGHPPFAADDDLELLRMHLREPVPDPRASWAQMPAPMAKTIMAMLAKDPALRPSLADVALVLKMPRLAQGTMPPLPAVVVPEPETEEIELDVVEDGDVLGRPRIALPWMQRHWIERALALALLVAAIALSV